MHTQWPVLSVTCAPHSLFHSAILNFRSLRFLLIPFISQPILHILSHPFLFPLYSLPFCFYSLLFIIVSQFWLLPNFGFSLLAPSFFSLLIVCFCRYFHSCPLFFYHNHLILSLATWLLTSFYLLFFVRLSSVTFYLVYLSILITFLLLFHLLFNFSHTCPSCFCRSLLLCVLSTFPVSTFSAFLPYSSPYHLSTSLPRFKKLCSQCVVPPP